MGIELVCVFKKLPGDKTSRHKTHVVFRRKGELEVVIFAHIKCAAVDLSAKNKFVKWQQYVCFITRVASVEKIRWEKLHLIAEETEMAATYVAVKFPQKTKGKAITNDGRSKFSDFLFKQLDTMF